MKDDDDEGDGVGSDEGDFKLFEGFCFLKDRQTDGQTNGHW